MELLPDSSTLDVKCQAGTMISVTAIVSPSARPRPSMVAPITPARPNGSTTVRIIPQRVEPSAYAPSRSPTGACEKTCLDSDVTMGMTMSETTTPAMKVELA